jgi:hypothetical protein
MSIDVFLDDDDDDNALLLLTADDGSGLHLLPLVVSPPTPASTV